MISNEIHPSNPGKSPKADHRSKQLSDGPLRAFRWAGDRTGIALALGLGTSLLAFYLAFGRLGIEPHRERYATFLTVPSLVLGALALVRTGALFGQPRFARQTTLLLACLLLVAFRMHYFGVLETSAPRAPLTFRTGPVEPKAAVLKQIEAQRDRSRRTVVMTEDWWVYWTLRYLCEAHTGYRITVPHEPDDFRFPADARLPELHPATDQLFAAGFVGGPLDRRFHGGGGVLSTTEIRGHGPTPLLRLYEIDPAGLVTTTPASGPPRPPSRQRELPR